MNMDFLKKKLGGIPVWVYALVAAVLIVAIYWYIHRSSSSSTSAGGATPDTSSTTSTPGTGDVGSLGGGFPGYSSGFNRGADSSSLFTPSGTTDTGTQTGTTDTGQVPQTVFDFPPITINVPETQQATPTPTPQPGTVPPKSPAVSLGAAVRAAAASVSRSSTGTIVSPSSYTAPPGTFIQQITTPLAKSPSSTKTIPYSVPTVSNKGETVTQTRPVEKPAASAQHYTATTGAIRAKRAG